MPLQELLGKWQHIVATLFIYAISAIKKQELLGKWQHIVAILFIYAMSLILADSVVVTVMI